MAPTTALEAVATGFRRSHAALAHELLEGVTNPKAQGMRIIIHLSGQHNGGGSAHAFTHSNVLLASTVKEGPYSKKTTAFNVDFVAALPPGYTQNSVYRNRIPFDTQQQADEAAAAMNAAPGVKVLAAAIFAVDKHSTLRECVSAAVDTIRENCFIPDLDFASAVLGYFGTARNMPNLAARVVAAVADESFGPEVLLAGMKTRHARIAAKGNAATAASAVAILKRYPGITAPTLNGTPICDFTIAGETVVAMYCANEPRCALRADFLPENPLKPVNQKGVATNQLGFTVAHSSIKRTAGCYATADAARHAATLFKTAGGWWAALLIFDVCADITDPAKRSPATVSKTLIRQLPKWNAPLDEQTLPLLTVVVEVTLARPSDDASAFDMGSKADVKETLALVAAGLGTVLPKYSKKAKYGYLQGRLQRTRKLTLGDVGVKGALASKPAIPLTDGIGTRPDPVYSTLDWALTVDALYELKDVPGGVPLKVKVNNAPSSTPCVVITGPGLVVKCGNHTDLATAEALAVALRNAPHAGAARVLLDKTLLANGCDAVAATWAHYACKWKLVLHDKTKAYLANRLALTLGGATADQLLAAVERKHANARVFAERVENTHLFRLNNMPAWKAYMAEFSNAVASGGGTLCPLCRKSKLAVGATSNTDATKRSVVVRGGEPVDACLQCSFFHNSPALADAKKSANLKAAKMYTPEGLAAEDKRVKEKAAAKGYTPHDFIVPRECP